MRRTFAWTWLTVLALAVGVVPAMAQETHLVEVSADGFSPSEISIRQGDTVIWTWMSGTHTITTGESPDDEEVGKLIDLPLDANNPQVTFTFESPGVFSYFSRSVPSLSGSVTVQDGTPVNGHTWGYLKSLFEDSARKARSARQARGLN